ncbi:hypothetical protein ETB97_007100 [Aspergillus alliaceus]|uniref:Glucose-methanol-choline oxidoreductase N-terminal domain-containing protein n=1 Tax=Petromyces alliaceus TaxID=209559 RepID=A0A8H5ZWY2_PETAA|nr:hypothetical protein ETB97_007100 [Aspergillus burnettii]
MQAPAAKICTKPEKGADSYIQYNSDTMAALLYALCVLPTTLATIGVGLSPNGVTELFGNSFGLPGENATYDYIVVGGGTAGVSTSALGYNGREILYVAGQTFGGSSASNYMGYARAAEGTFDEWSKIVDDDLWSWENVYPAYKKSCNFTAPNYNKIDPSFNIPYDVSAFESTGGPLQVSYGNYLGPYGPYLEESLDKLGIERLPGFNSGRLIGYATITTAIDLEEATRSSSETSFLQLAAQHSNIKLYPQTLGSRILFDENKQATGVEVQTNSSTSKFKYHLNANKEVIVSAVALSSNPDAVRRWPIRETLQKYNIPIVADLSGVGQGARDQPWMALSYKVNVTTGTQVAAGNAEFSAARVEEYLTNQTGLLSSIGGGQALAFEKFFPPPTPSGIQPIHPGLPRHVPEARISPIPPIISPNWLLDEGDQEQAIAALQRIREIAFNSTIVEEEYLPGPNVTTRTEILEWLKDNMSLIYHATSSCKMGISNDTTAVVDSRARVRGVTGLRVVDASVFPLVPPTFPMATVYMFAEKIAESILGGQ